MAARELEVQEPDATVIGALSNEEVPIEKSGVYLDPNAPDQSRKYAEKDLVHMSLVQSGVRTKGIFSVAKARLHSSKQYYEYQLVDGDGKAYKNGAWIREKELRLEKKLG